MVNKGILEEVATEKEKQALSVDDTVESKWISLDELERQILKVFLNGKTLSKYQLRIEAINQTLPHSFTSLKEKQKFWASFGGRDRCPEVFNNRFNNPTVFEQLSKKAAKKFGLVLPSNNKIKTMIEKMVGLKVIVEEDTGKRYRGGPKFRYRVDSTFFTNYKNARANFYEKLDKDLLNPTAVTLVERQLYDFNQEHYKAQRWCKKQGI